MTLPIYYSVYETTNLINNKKYRGKHTSNDPYDTYLGSGSAIKRAISHYGKDNFKKDVIFLAFTPEYLDWAETVLVNDEWISRKDTYNLIPGGYGGHKGIIRTKENRKNISDGLQGHFCSAERRKKISESLKGNVPWNKGVPASEEQKQKQSKSMKGKMCGDNNPSKRDDVREKLRKPKSDLGRNSMILAAKNRPKCSCLMCHREISTYQITNHYRVKHKR